MKIPLSIKYFKIKPNETLTTLTKSNEHFNIRAILKWKLNNQSDMRFTIHPD